MVVYTSVELLHRAAYVLFFALGTCYEVNNIGGVARKLMAYAIGGGCFLGCGFKCGVAYEMVGAGCTFRLSAGGDG